MCVLLQNLQSFSLPANSSLEVVSLEVELVEVRLPADKGREVQKEKRKKVINIFFKTFFKKHNSVSWSTINIMTC